MKKITLFLVFTGLLLASCKKEATIKSTPNSEKKIQSIDFSNSSGTAYSSLYSYDNTGKLKEIRYKSETETFTYNSPFSISVKRVLHADPSIYTNDLYTLNNKGTVEKIETIYPNGSTFSITSFIYNADNILQVIETEYPMQNKIYRFEYSITNKIKTSQSFYINAVLQSREEYSYDMSRMMKGMGQLDRNIYFPGLYGADQQFPLSGIKFFDAAGNLVENRSYISVLDKNGYIISYTGNDLFSKSTFTYQINY